MDTKRKPYVFSMSIAPPVKEISVYYEDDSGTSNLLAASFNGNTGFWRVYGPFYTDLESLVELYYFITTEGDRRVFYASSDRTVRDLDFKSKFESIRRYILDSRARRTVYEQGLEEFKKLHLI